VYDQSTLTVDTLKRQTLKQLFNQSKRYLICRHLQKTSRRQDDDQFLSIPDGQSSNLDPLIQWSRQWAKCWL